MRPRSQSRRDVLKGAAAAAVLMSSPRVARAQAMQARTRIDSILKQAVAARDVPGVVTMAATGILVNVAANGRVRAAARPQSYRSSAHPAMRPAPAR